ncbi:ribosome maturation factor RimM [Parasediminibacterium sp. JCM 36343]|uniref:ribosome maturation factor RimM n=1 Tax=Parasediminibacterium sp. JCM 36343 TaxID=3374279 RepID=UPI0039796521
MEEYINIGKIVATFGLNGELILQHKLAKKLTFKNVDAVFIEEVKGSFIPYFLVASKAKTVDETYIELEGIGTKEKAKKIIGKQTYLLETDFRRLAGKASPIAMIGYKVMEGTELLGNIEEIIEQPHQVLIRITYKGNEALIPLHAETLQSIDRKKGILYVTLPDGLLEIYG